MALSELSAKERKQIIADFDGEVAEGLSHCQDIHERWSTNQGYVAMGMQWKPGDIEKMRRKKLPPVELNDTFKIINAISNREIVERFAPKILARDSQDGGIANVGDELCRWQRQTANSEHYESMAFRSAVICGYGAAQKSFDPTADGGRGLVVDRDIPLPELLWPARCRDQNLLDKDWVICGRWVSASKAEARYGSVSPAIRRKFRELKRDRASSANSRGEDYPQEPAGRFPTRGSNNGFGWEAVNSKGWVDSAHTEVFVAEREWKEIEYVWRAKVPVRFYEWHAMRIGRQPMVFEQPPDEQGNPSEPFVLYPENYDQMDAEQQAQILGEALAETQEYVFETRKELNEFLDMWVQTIGTEFVQYQESGRSVIKYAIRIDDELVDYGTRPWGWSYHFITGFPRETIDGMMFYGCVDIVKSAQDLRNAIVSAMVARYKSDPKGAFVFSKSVGDIERIAEKMSSPEAIVQLDDQIVANLEQHIKNFPAGNFSPMGPELLGIFTNSVLSSLGVDPISMNSQSDLRRVSGNVVQSAQAASNVIIALLYDSLRLFRRQFGLCNMRFLHYLYDYEEVLRIVGSEKAADMEALGEDSWDNVVLFDMIIDEAPTTPSERMEMVTALTATGTINEMYARGDISAENMVESFMPALPESEKRKILEGRRLTDQIAQLQEQINGEQAAKQALYQKLSGIPGGVELIAEIESQTKQNQMSSELFQAPDGGPQ